MKIYTLEEYIKAPKSRRENKWGWYLHPDGFLWNGVFNTPNEFDAYWKKEYPIQFFFRETLNDFLKGYFVYPFKRWKYKVHDFFFPKQKWLTKQIPNEYCDKVELIPDILFKILIAFVEEEDGLNHRTWYYECPCTGQIVDNRNIEEDLKRAYRYAKEIRNRLEKKTWQTKYPHSISFDKLYNKCEDHYCTIIIKHRQYLWT